MSVLVWAALWVVVAAIVAMLPIRYQYVPGLLLLLSVPALIFLLWRDFGVFVALFAVFSVLSMFRKPLRHFAKRLVSHNRKVSR